MNFTLLDWGILAVYLAVVFYFGLMGKKYVKTSEDYLLAGRSMGVYVGAISLLATEIGIITYMYYAEMGYLFGFTSFLAGVLAAAIYIFLGQSGFVIKKFREKELVTISQLFEERYGRDVRILAGILMAIGGALNFGVFPIIEGTFLNIVTGIPQDYIIWTMVFLMATVLIYTALGGMFSVIITNYIQYVVLVLGMILITIYCFLDVGWGSMVDTVRSRMGSQGFDPFTHPDFGWKFIFWQTLAWLASLTAWAPVASRTFAAESPSATKKIFTWTGVLFLGRAILPFMWGIAALAYLKGASVPSIQATPIMLREILPMGIAGLVVAGMLAASMSTYSGYLLAWSSVISQDVIIPIVHRPLKDRTHLLINRITVLALAVFIVAWGLFYIVPGATYFYLQMTANIFLAGTFWSILGGLYWKQAHRLGAYCALIFGGSTTLLYFIVPDPRAWTTTIGVLSYALSFAGMIAGSLVGTYVRSLRIRLLILFALVAAAAGGWYVTAGMGADGLWLQIWTVAFWVALLSFVLWSVYAVWVGWAEVRRMIRPAQDPQ